MMLECKHKLLFHPPTVAVINLQLALVLSRRAPNCAKAYSVFFKTAQWQHSAARHCCFSTAVSSDVADNLGQAHQ